MPVTALGISSSVLPDGDLGGDAGDGVAGGLGGQGGGAADAGVDLDDVILVAFGVEGKLDVAAAFDPQRADDLEAGRAQHLVFFVGEGLAGRDDDAVAGVDAHRVEVFHVADGDAVIGGVAHDLVLDFFPAAHALLDQHLVDRAGLQPAWPLSRSSSSRV